MNAVIARVSAVICTMSLMPVSAPLFAGAAEWINLSSWSYEEVSGFVSEGLLPACLGDSFDFTRPITRGEFAELLYSVLVNTGRISEESIYGQFADCADYPSVNKLDVNVFNGLACDGQNFLPTQVLTREEAALIFYNTLCSLYLLRYFEPQDGARASDTLNDSGDISSYALDAVDVMISGGFMSDTGDGDFEPRGEMTVEQAVAVMYRIYKWIPRLIYSDKEMLGENGERARTYDNGLEESFRDGKYVITDNGTELLSFDPDVYSKISCCDHSGRRLAFAVNFNDKTDVYDLDSGTVLFSIPYIVYRLEPEDGFVYVYSSRFMPAYSGLYSFRRKGAGSARIQRERACRDS